MFPVSHVGTGSGRRDGRARGVDRGADQAERAAGYFSEFGGALTGPSSCTGRDFGIALASGTATVPLCRTVTYGGVGQDARMRAQIEATLRQFPYDPSGQAARAFGSLPVR